MSVVVRAENCILVNCPSQPLANRFWSVSGSKKYGDFASEAETPCATDCSHLMEPTTFIGRRFECSHTATCYVSKLRATPSFCTRRVGAEEEMVSALTFARSSGLFSLKFIIEISNSVLRARSTLEAKFEVLTVETGPCPSSLSLI